MLQNRSKAASYEDVARKKMVVAGPRIIYNEKS